ncbi:Hypothetical predicted protein, partial [Pelobates cultripes]
TGAAARARGFNWAVCLDHVARVLLRAGPSAAPGVRAAASAVDCAPLEVVGGAEALKSTRAACGMPLGVLPSRPAV